MRRSLVVGNWKMHGSQESVIHLLNDLNEQLGGLEGVDMGVCPPFVYLPLVADKLAGTQIAWGGQDISHCEAGAHTGDIAAEMLGDFNCRYVIVGHSERRADHGESSERVAEKYLRALNAGLTPILCVGETLAEREAEQTLNVIGEQLQAVLGQFGSGRLDSMVIAYEPVWAIGTGKTASPEQAQQVHRFIRETLARESEILADSTRILYGGSVKPDNAEALFAEADIDGGLIGGAALIAEDFAAICRAGI